MANLEHLAIFQQGVQVWDRWRMEHPEIHPDLSDVDQDLSQRFIRGVPMDGANLRDVNLAGTWLKYKSLKNTDLRGANLERAYLRLADLQGADLSGANLHEAILDQAHLEGANLSKTQLWGASLFEANLRRANLSDANLTNSDLTKADFFEADFRGAEMTRTILGDVNLRGAKGLEMVIHHGPLVVGIDTIYRSQGQIPEVFLRGAGVPENFLIYMHSQVSQSVNYYTCFISYSSKDHAFAQRLYADLQSKGVRCWFAPEDLKIGDKWRDRIDEAVRMYDKLLLVLSEHSVESIWVEREVEAAFEKEHRENRLVLFPVRLDEAVMPATQAWAADIRRMRHIGDFTRWKEHDEYQKAFARLIRDLKAEAQKMGLREGITNGGKL